ncbi:39S ribosomal protein L28 mitochondrial [Paragonimus skrjabini miyazakii]|uniref:Large ribosomal subunit protein bL28m n=1 Tax=Paragonimus skrjabini miyazakii TaxID=59628 RepID=A0A8S9YAB8_9TREM|nr:39S ribosomal protein L28 mitochondrial [Paragonimus skrjabini miyazakii]
MHRKTKEAQSWTPKLSQHVFYSDILDRWMIIVVSDSALHAIEKAGDLDTYILSTPEEKMQSRLDPSFCSDDEQKRALFNKHQNHIIPREEAEWIGLTLEEAIKKQQKLDYEAARSKLKPQKYVLFNKVFEDLDSASEGREGSSAGTTESSTVSILSRLLHGEKRATKR